MFNQKVTYEKSCVVCKVGSGLFFSGFGAFHQARMKSIWSQFNTSQKLFNVSMLVVIYGFAFASFNAAYEIKMGKQMALVEMRPSYSSRISEFYHWSKMDEK